MPQPQPGLLDLGVLDHVEQELLGRLEQEGLERLGMHLHRVADFDVDGQAVFGPDVLGQPFEGFAEIALPEHRRAQLVGQAAGFVDGLREQFLDLLGHVLHILAVFGSIAQQAHVELRGREHLLEVVVENLGQPLSFAVFRLGQFQRQLLKLSGPLLDLLQGLLLLGDVFEVQYERLHLAVFIQQRRDLPVPIRYAPVRRPCVIERFGVGAIRPLAPHDVFENRLILRVGIESRSDSCR